MKLRACLCKVSPQYRLRLICRAIGIKPYGWQREFALGKTNVLNAPPGRATGKTTAIMLRLLMAEPGAFDVRPSASRYFALDPDWLPNEPQRCRWYYREYRYLWRRCFDAEIYPFYINHIQRRMP